MKAPTSWSSTRTSALTAPFASRNAQPRQFSPKTKCLTISRNTSSSTPTWLKSGRTSPRRRTRFPTPRSGMALRTSCSTWSVNSSLEKPPAFFRTLPSSECMAEKNARLSRDGHFICVVPSGLVDAALDCVFHITFDLLRFAFDFLALALVLHALVVSRLAQALLGLAGGFIEVAFHLVGSTAHKDFLLLSMGYILLSKQTGS